MSEIRARPRKAQYPARLSPRAETARRDANLDPSRPTVVFCAGGYRSSIAASLLRRAGFGDVSDILGGYHAWEALRRAEPSFPDRSPPHSLAKM